MPLNRHITPERKLVMRNTEDGSEISVAPMGFHGYEIYNLLHDLSGEVKFFEGSIRVKYGDILVPGKWDSKGVFFPCDTIVNKEYDLVFCVPLPVITETK